MFSPRILSINRFAIAGIDVEICSSEWTPSPEYDSLVNAAWKELLARSTHPLWDGTYYRVLSPQDLDRGGIRLGTIRYRYIATFPALHQEHERLQLEPLYHLSTVALIRTCDGCYLFGRRTRNREMGFIGGGVQRDELEIASGSDLERNLLKEIQEETGIQCVEVRQLNGIGILLSATSNVLIAGHADLSVTKAEALARFARRAEDEMSELVLVLENELGTVLRSMTAYRRLILELIEPTYC